MTFEEEFPNLKGKEELVKTNPLFPEYMVRSGDIKEHCLDKRVVYDKLIDIKNSDNVFAPLINHLIRELGLEAYKHENKSRR